MTIPSQNERKSDSLGEQDEPGLLFELVDFLKHNRKWWLIPILVVLALFGVIAALATTSVAPFLYTLF